MDIRRNILVFGNSAMLGVLAADLRDSPLLEVIERKEGETLDALHPDIILVDAFQTNEEHFRDLIPICPTILSLDPVTHQLNILSSPRQADLAEIARVVEMLSLTLHQPA